MRLFTPTARKCPELGQALVDRIARLQHPPTVHQVRYRWYLRWWDLRRKPKRRGVPVS